MARKSRSQKWFVPVRGSYLPNNWKGWLTYIPFVAFLLISLKIDWNYNGSKSQGILVTAADWVAAVVVMTWIAKRTS